MILPIIFDFSCDRTSWTSPRGVWVRCRTTFLYCGEYRVVETYRFGVENVLNVKSKISAFQNIQKIWKRLSIEKVTKDLVLDFPIQKSHVAFTMHVPCIPYISMMYGIHGTNTTWLFWIRKSDTKSFVTFSILNCFEIFWMFWKAEILLFTFSTFSTQKRQVSITLHSPQYKKAGSVLYPYPPRH